MTDGQKTFGADTIRQLADVVPKWAHQQTVIVGLLDRLLQPTITPVTIEHIFRSRLEIQVIEKHRIPYKSLGKRKISVTEVIHRRHP